MVSTDERRMSRGSSSRSSSDRRVGRLSRRDSGLIALPPEILASIMLHVSRSLGNYFVARASIRTLRRVTDDESFLREVDLFTMQTPNRFEDGIRDFRILCHHRGNISALFLQGCSEFFRLGNLDNGLAIIREAANRGYELAIYAYSSLIRIMSPNFEFDPELSNPNRDLVRRMRSRIEASTFRYWGPNGQLPALFLERVGSFDYRIICRCRCRCASLNRWCHLWDEAVKDPSMCDLCFSIHAYGFARIFPEKVIDWPMMKFYF